jgi:hypothetical protein
VNNPTNYITPEQAIAKGDSRSIEELTTMAESDAGDCDVCEQPAWKFGGAGMCFTCTTGEADSSADYELIPSKEA